MPTDPTTALTDHASEPVPVRTVAGALAHLATHMETGCPRAAWLAAMLLERIAADPAADAHLRHHARALVEILERDGDLAATRDLSGSAKSAAHGPRH